MELALGACGDAREQATVLLDRGALRRVSLTACSPMIRSCGGELDGLSAEGMEPSIPAQSCSPCGRQRHGQPSLSIREQSHMATNKAGAGCCRSVIFLVG